MTFPSTLLPRFRAIAPQLVAEVVRKDLHHPHHRTRHRRIHRYSWLAWTGLGPEHFCSDHHPNHSILLFSSGAVCATQRYVTVASEGSADRGSRCGRTASSCVAFMRNLGSRASKLSCYSARAACFLAILTSYSTDGWDTWACRVDLPSLEEPLSTSRRHSGGVGIPRQSAACHFFRETSGARAATAEAVAATAGGGLRESTLLAWLSNYAKALSGC